jgi:hypothetical protein
MWFRRAAAIFALAACLVGPLAVAICGALHHSPQTPGQSGATNYYNKPNTTSQSPEEAIARYNWWLAVLTAILAVATVGLGIGTFFQIRLARTEFISTHRPRLRVRRITVIQPIVPNQRCGANIEIANIGDTKATIVEFGIDIYGESYPFSAVPTAQQIVVKAGAQVNFAVVGQILTQDRIHAIAEGMEKLRVLGIANYRDDNGVMRSTSFARVYDPGVRWFVKIPPGDQEADREFED